MSWLGLVVALLSGCHWVFALEDAPPVDFTPSNGVDRAWLDEVTEPIVITDLTVFNTDTGSISGAFERAAGESVIDGIGYRKLTDQQPNIGVFVMHELTITGEVRFEGTSAVAWLAATVSIPGIVDGSGGCGGVRDCAGPGGGLGGIVPTPATGCGPGAPGLSATTDDTGGGGGGGGTNGGDGGSVGVTSGGTGGAACLERTLEPLVGGSGGGGGGPGAMFPSPGGGGGGALQITALNRIEIAGTIRLAGAGGGAGFGGVGAPANASAGAGGGAGGGLLLEASSITLLPASRLAANGGGGGGSGEFTTAGEPGANGGDDLSPAQGGRAPSALQGNGGRGGSSDEPASAGEMGTKGGGGGGGAAGVIFLRTRTSSRRGSISPAPDFEVL